MKIFNKIADTNDWLNHERHQERSIGFVPTMGALHKGHISLMQRAKAENDILVASIFVNPIQFNNPLDLEKYPRNLEKDIHLLEKIGCHMLFSPSAEEMYPEPPTEKFDFGGLENVMEGSFRPGHFNGVAIVVKRLFDIIKPTRSYFGEKDFQQLAIIQHLVQQENIPVEIVPCPTEREFDGLAMSSRNERLSAEERNMAPFIYKALIDAKNQVVNLTPEEVRLRLNNQFADQPAFELEYFEIADNKNLKPVNDWNSNNGIRGFIAAHLGKVRLIDNIQFI